MARRRSDVETVTQEHEVHATNWLLILLDKFVITFVFILFFVSGFAALLYQVIWQRILAIFSGADVYSITIIVAAFMAGLGIGSLAGGYLADRVSTRIRIVLFAVCESAIALFALFSTWIYYDQLYQRYSYLAGTPEMLAGVLFISLLWPTFFMGMSLPLLSKSLARTVEGAAGIVGALYGFNTLGAAVGACATAWYFIRIYGFDTTIKLGAVLDFGCAIGALLIAPVFLSNLLPDSTSKRSQKTILLSADNDPGYVFPASVWIILYALSGFIALSLEIVWFRLLGIMLKSTAFTFGTLLAIYLAGLATGTFLGIGWSKKSRSPAQFFLALQTAIPLYAGMSLNIFCALVDQVPILKPIWTYLGSYEPLDMSAAITAVTDYLTGKQLSAADTSLMHNFILLYGIFPFVIIGPPTLMMGMSFPFLQKVVQRNVLTLGRRVGWLQTMNITGSLIGTLVTGWLLLRVFGTSTTLQILLGIGGIFLFLYLYSEFAFTYFFSFVKFGLTIALVLVIFSLSVPSAPLLWSKLHGTTRDKIIFAEDGAGLSLLKGNDSDFTKTTVFVNGIGQSEIPYGGVHTMLGMVPVMIHPDPKRVAVIGLGSGDTVFAAGGRTETAQVTCIEIIGSQLATLQMLNRDHKNNSLETLLANTKISYVFTDGRAYINLGNTNYDVIEADALRPDSAYAGNLYSYEYFTLLKNHLNPGGLAVTWAPTQRVKDTFVKVFPYITYFAGGIDIMIGSNDPIPWDINLFSSRLKEPATKAYYSNAGIDVDNYINFFAGMKPFILAPDYNRVPLTDLNTDLFPKDEYLTPK